MHVSSSPFLFCASSVSFTWNYYSLYLFRAFTKLRKVTISFVMSVAHLPVCLSVCQHGTTRLPMGEFSRYFISEYFSKICRDNSSFITMCKNNVFFPWRPVCIYDNISLLQDHSLKLCCYDVLGLVGDPLSGNGCGSPDHIILIISFYLFFIYSIYCW